MDARVDVRGYLAFLDGETGVDALSSVAKTVEVWPVPDGAIDRPLDPLDTRDGLDPLGGLGALDGLPALDGQHVPRGVPRVFVLTDVRLYAEGLVHILER